MPAESALGTTLPPPRQAEMGRKRHSHQSPAVRLWGNPSYPASQPPHQYLCVSPSSWGFGQLREGRGQRSVGPEQVPGRLCP